MPKLNKTQAKSVSAAKSSFEALEPGVYAAVLDSVEVRTPRSGGSGYDYWSWKFVNLVNVESGEKAPGSQWTNTSLSPDAEWKMKEVFDAFGVPADTDTDTLLGQSVLLAISQREIESGSRMGEIGNQVDRVLPVGDDEEAATG